MKNWEKYEEAIKEIGFSFAVLKSSNEVVDCAIGRRFSCNECLFVDEPGYTCEDDRVKWLYSEYKEPVVLTDDERKLCELLGDGWIARDKSGKIFYYNEEPFKNKETELWGTCYEINISVGFPQCKFEFINWKMKTL